MINYISAKQSTLSQFITPYDGDLLADYRCVKLSLIVPWETFDNRCVSLVNSSQDRPGISPKIVLGTLIIKYKENFSDEKKHKQSKKTYTCSFSLDYKVFK